MPVLLTQGRRGGPHDTSHTHHQQTKRMNLVLPGQLDFVELEAGGDAGALEEGKGQDRERPVVGDIRELK